MMLWSERRHAARKRGDCQVQAGSYHGFRAGNEFGDQQRIMRPLVQANRFRRAGFDNFIRIAEHRAYGQGEYLERGRRRTIRKQGAQGRLDTADGLHHNIRAAQAGFRAQGRKCSRWILWIDQRGNAKHAVGNQCDILVWRECAQFALRSRVAYRDVRACIEGSGNHRRGPAGHRAVNRRGIPGNRHAVLLRQQRRGQPNAERMVQCGVRREIARRDVLVEANEMAAADDQTLQLSHAAGELRKRGNLERPGVGAALEVREALQRQCVDALCKFVVGNQWKQQIAVIFDVERAAHCNLGHVCSNFRVVAVNAY